MFKCDFCGIAVRKKISMYGHIFCSKHMHQYLKYGEVLDHIQRTNSDLNEYRFTKEGLAEFDVYGRDNKVCGHFLIDKDDLNKVRWHKWRIDTNGRVITGNCTKKRPRRELSRFLLDVTDPTVVVDHIDGSPLNNSRSNLRVCTQSENLFNRSFIPNNTTGIIGVSWDKHRNKWAPEIRTNYKRWHLGRYDTLSEAAYARFIAECIVFGGMQNKEQALLKVKLFHKDLSHERKTEIKQYVKAKLGDKSTVENGYQLCRGPQHAEQHSSGAGGDALHLR